LQQSAEDLSAIQIGEWIADNQIPSQRLGAGAQYGQRLRMHLGVDEERPRLGVGRALRQRHRFGRRSRLIE